MRFLDKLGWPVEQIKGRPVLNFFRLLIHTRHIARHWEPPKSSAISGDTCEQAPAYDGWARIEMMVSPSGQYNVLSGDRAPGDPMSDRSYLALDWLRKRYTGGTGDG